MAQSTADRLQSVLKMIEASTHDIVATAIVNTDGLIMASRLPPNVEEDRVGAMSAAISSLGDRSGKELYLGEMQQVFVKGTHGYLVLMNIGSDAVLVTLASEKIKLGLLFLELRRASERLMEVFQFLPEY
jgi:predicted regulator of Ras-like GTPase activity (Roadblock/LC7/MglB family)